MAKFGAVPQGNYTMNKKNFYKKNKIMYFKHTNRKNLIMQMKIGYVKMGALNLRLSKEGIHSDNESLFIIEHNAECI